MNEAIHQLRLMQESDLEMVLSWRNHSDIQKHMYSRHEISLSEHRDWFANASNDPNTDLFVFEIDRKPTGFVKFGAKAAKKNAEWGFYIAPDAPRGSGSALGNASLNPCVQHAAVSQDFCRGVGGKRTIIKISQKTWLH